VSKDLLFKLAVFVEDS